MWMSFNYIGPGAYSKELQANIDVGGNTGTGVTGVTVSTTEDEIIYAIACNWYGEIACIIEWHGNDNLQYVLNSTSTNVF
jgi:hypothetical protein